MICFILLSLFSLFVGINNVNAWEYDTSMGERYYLNENLLNAVNLKDYIDTYKSYDYNGTTYVFEDYNSYMFYRVNGSYPSDNYILYTAFGENITLSVSEENSNYLTVSFSNSKLVNRLYNNLGNYNGDYSNFIHYSELPLYTKNVMSKDNVFVRVSSTFCSNFGSFCDNASEADTYGQVYVQIAWKNGEFKGLLNLAEGGIVEVPTDYTVKIYVDDKLKDSYSDTGIVGKTITLKGLDDNSLKASENNKYEVTLVDGTNEFELRYYTSTYGTVYQQINTDNSELYLPFSYDKLKSVFPGINFELWTSYEQFNFVLVFNIFFILFLIFIGYIILKMFYFVKGWFL